MQTTLECVDYLCLSADGTRLAVSQRVGGREVWAAPFGAADRILKTNPPEWPGGGPITDGRRSWFPGAMCKLVLDQTGSLFDAGTLATIPFLAVPQELLPEDESAPEEAELTDFALSPDEELLVTSTGNMVGSEFRGFLKGWARSGNTWEARWAVDSDSFDVHALAFLSNPTRLVVVEENLGRDAARPDVGKYSSLLTVRNARTGELIAERTIPALDYARWQQLAVGGREPVVVLGYRDELRVYNPNDLSDLDAEPKVIKAEWVELHGMAFHPDGRFLLTVANVPRVVIWDTETWTVAREFDWQIGNVHAVGVSADGHLAAAGGDTGAVAVWDWEV